MKATMMKTLMVSALALTLSTTALAQERGGGTTVGGGGEAMRRGRGFELRDLLPEGGSCLWQTSAQFQAQVPAFEELLRAIDGMNWIFAEELRKEVTGLSFCATGGRLRHLPPEAMRDVTVYMRNAVQVAVRSGNEVYVDSDIFGQLPPRTQGLLIAHEALHGFIDLDVENRDIKIRSMVTAFNILLDGNLTASDLAYQMTQNGVNAYRGPTDLSAVPAEVAALYRRVRDLPSTAPEEERVLLRLQLWMAVAPLPSWVVTRTTARVGATDAGGEFSRYVFRAPDEAEFRRRMTFIPPTSLGNETNPFYEHALGKGWLGLADELLQQYPAEKQQRMLRGTITQWSNVPLELRNERARAIGRGNFPRYGSIQFVLNHLTERDRFQIAAGAPYDIIYRYDVADGYSEVGSIAARLLIRALYFNQPVSAHLIRQTFAPAGNFIAPDILSLAVKGDAFDSVRSILRANPALRSRLADLKLAAHQGDPRILNLLWGRATPETKIAPVKARAEPSDGVGYYFDRLNLIDFLTTLGQYIYLNPEIVPNHSTMRDVSGYLNYMQSLDYLEIAILSRRVEAVRLIANDAQGPLGRPDHRRHATMARTQATVSGDSTDILIAEIVEQVATRR